MIEPSSLGRQSRPRRLRCAGGCRQQRDRRCFPCEAPSAQHPPSQCGRRSQLYLNRLYLNRLYLNEYVFRFNRRSSRQRGMLFFRLRELAVGHDPVRDRDLIYTRRPARTAAAPPGARGKPDSLEPERTGALGVAPALTAKSLTRTSPVRGIPPLQQAELRALCLMP